MSNPVSRQPTARLKNSTVVVSFGHLVQSQGGRGLDGGIVSWPRKRRCFGQSTDRDFGMCPSRVSRLQGLRGCLFAFSCYEELHEVTSLDRWSGFGSICYCSDHTHPVSFYKNMTVSSGRMLACAHANAPHFALGAEWGRYSLAAVARPNAVSHFGRFHRKLKKARSSQMLHQSY